MEIPKIVCVKLQCGTSAELDVAGMRKDADGWKPVNAQRPPGWVTGPADAHDATQGLCPAHAAEWERAKNEFLASDVPPPPAPAALPRKFGIKPAQCDPVGEHVMQKVAATTRAPDAPAPPMRTGTAIPFQAPKVQVPKIMPTIGKAAGGYACALPTSTPSTPILKSFQTNGPTMGVAHTQPAKVEMHVITKTSPLPGRINSTPSHHGEMQPVHHDRRAGVLQQAPQLGFGAAEVTMTPFVPASK